MATMNVDLPLPIRKGIQKDYDELSSRDSNTLYIITDTKAIYLGDILLTGLADLVKFFEDKIVSIIEDDTDGDAIPNVAAIKDFVANIVLKIGTF